MKLIDSLYKVISDDRTATSHVYSIELAPEHFIYKAHFPGEPITPGVCIMQIAKELLEESIGGPLELSCVKNVKFLRIISPAEVTGVDYILQKISTENDEVKVQVSVSAGDDTYAKLSLICRKK